MFSKATLNRVAGKFTLSDAYYMDDVKKRPVSMLPEGEVSSIKGELTDTAFQLVLDIYTSMTPMDANLLGTRLPTTVLAEICGIDKSKAISLKKLCNFMRDMKPEVQQSPVEEEPSPPPVVESKKPKVPTMGEQKVINEKIRPFLNMRKLANMPVEYVEDFARTPRHILRKLWTGPQFNVQTDRLIEAYNAGRCKNISSLKDILKEEKKNGGRNHKDEADTAGNEAPSASEG